MQQLVLEEAQGRPPDAVALGSGRSALKAFFQEQQARSCLRSGRRRSPPSRNVVFVSQVKQGRDTSRSRPNLVLRSFLGTVAEYQIVKIRTLMADEFLLKLA